MDCMDCTFDSKGMKRAWKILFLVLVLGVVVCAIDFDIPMFECKSHVLLDNALLVVLMRFRTLRRRHKSHLLHRETL